MSDLKSGLQWRQEEASVDRTVGDEYRNTPKKKINIVYPWYSD